MSDSGIAGMRAEDHEAPRSLAQLAEWYFEVCELYADKDLDPADPVAVLVRAFVSSDCGPFAYALHRMTGWQVLNIASPIGPLHSLVEAPDGRWLDAAGWVTQTSIARRYRTRKITAAPVAPEAAMGVAAMTGLDYQGFDEELCRLVHVIRSLPHPPFSEPWFQDISGRPVEGVDFPVPDEATDSHGAPGPTAG